MARLLPAIAIVALIGAASAHARPTLWYPIETGGTTQNDNGIAPQANGTLTGAATTLYGSAPGGFSCACLDLTPFTTTGNYITTTTDVAKIDGLAAMTVTMWINLRAAPADRDCLISDRPPGAPPSGQGGWELRIVNPYGGGTISASSFSLSFDLMRSFGTYTEATGAPSYAIDASNRWVFIAVTYDAANARRYYMGTESTTVSLLGPNSTYPWGLLDNYTPLRIGSSSYEPAVERTPPAWIDDVRIYNTALTLADLQQIRLENLQAPSMPGVPGFFCIGDLPGLSCSNYGVALSTDGSTIVGRATSVNGVEAYRWQNGVFTALGDLPGGNFASIAQGVSADGATVVGYGWSATAQNAPWRWQNGTLFDLGDLPGGDNLGMANAVSADGATVVGYSSMATYSVTAFRWTLAGLCPLPTLPNGAQSIAYSIADDASVIVGTATTLDGYETFWYDNITGNIASLGDLPAGIVAGRGYKISAGKDVVVGVGNSASGTEAALWRVSRQSGTVASRVFALGDLPGGSNFYSEAWGVSAHGSRVVGNSRGTSDVLEAFIWDRQHGMRKLLDVLQTDYGQDLTYWTLTYAQGVSRDGSVIMGYGRHPAGYTATWVAKLPPLPAVADFNDNDRVDSTDLARFLECTTGPETPYTPLPPGCTMSPDVLGLIPADLDWDGDVDQEDFGILQGCFGGPSQSPPDACKG